VAECFVDGGAYSDPSTPGPLSGQALAGYVDSLVTMFPDLSFDLVSEAWVGEDTLVAEWLMRGRNTGPLPGGVPPLGRTIELPGIDVLVTRGDRVLSVRGMFDRVKLYEQLGLKVTPMPARPIGPFSFGGGTLVRSGSTAIPQAFGMTALEIRGDEEQAEVERRARMVMAELIGVPGFIAAMGLTFGNRMFTISAWDSPQGPRGVGASASHRDSVRAMYKDTWAAAASSARSSPPTSGS
jgi:predicted ester cyclase/heme-degrading monooxygenase HmoA